MKNKDRVIRKATEFDMMQVVTGKDVLCYESTFDLRNVVDTCESFLKLIECNQKQELNICFAGKSVIDANKEVVIPIKNKLGINYKVNVRYSIFDCYLNWCIE